MTPTFSIVIPVYNRAGYLRQAIASALAQTADDFEVVVADDCSTEDIAGLVESFADPRLRYARNPANLGAAGNHQRAVALARGEFVKFLHSDDLLLPECLQSCQRGLASRPDAAALYFPLALLRGDAITGVQAIPTLDCAKPRNAQEAAPFEAVGCIAPTGCMFRRSVFDRLGGVCGQLKLAYDWELYMRFLRDGGGVVFHPVILGLYRCHGEQSIEAPDCNGLDDVLRMWSWPAYAHWSRARMAALVLAQFRFSRGPAGWRQIWRSVHGAGCSRRLTWPLLRLAAGRLAGRRPRQQEIVPMRALDSELQAQRPALEACVRAAAAPMPARADPRREGCA